jgi:hypothetical protein
LEEHLMDRTEKTRDWFGDEKEDHFDDNGNKVGETHFKKDWCGDRIQEHFDSDGNKVGETRESPDWLGENRAEHLDSDGNRVGTSYNRTDSLSDPVQEHCDSSGMHVGETRLKKDWLGYSFKEHEGTYFKTPNTQRSDKEQDGTYRTTPNSQRSETPGDHSSSHQNSAQIFPSPLRWFLAGSILVLIIAAGPQMFVWISEWINDQTDRAATQQDRPPEWQIREDAKRVPAALKSILDEEYPGWFFPNVAAEDRRICRQTSPGFLPGLVWGDFDGDGVRDYGVAIRQGNRRHTLIFLARARGFKEFSLEPSGWNILGVEPKGSALPHLEADGNGFRQAEPVRLERDALIGIHCESSAVAYLYSNGVFRSFFISD